MEVISHRRQWRWFTPLQEQPITKKEFAALPKDAQAHLYVVMKKYATNTHQRRHVKHIDGPIHEIRASLGNNQYRVLFFNPTPVHSIALRVFYKDTSRIPKQDLDIAKDRMSEWIRHNELHSKYNK
ncbi:type II toxin-antitoxin system RelE/ParE family toxin [Glutamicibacter halophytocola]|uniref:Type II toxin-antitoxin system RelE/ParE family toxin n=1 Tax=Glutamicibacter halophytocola TaxID=1933880 RepID=A0AA94XYC7_9MICC|nr:type II toxin-antitoxin system RelE/ParE family toxin [Glutamicibacter halophytocola]UUX60196.1 type II toxin-antitoxin system RelE/ParE family toxin [Glutamicibacter halophytocola]